MFVQVKPGFYIPRNSIASVELNGTSITLGTSTGTYTFSCATAEYDEDLVRALCMPYLFVDPQEGPCVCQVKDSTEYDGDALDVN